MKNLLTIVLIITLASCSNTKEQSAENEHADHSQHMAESTEKPKSKSPKQMAMANVGDNHIHVEYSSPSVRGRQIFGGLVAYGEVWVTGAHKATNITFQNDVVINDQTIPAGKYGFFTIPGQEEWTIVINKNWDMHLADDYDQQQDVLRFQVTPQHLEESVESLTYEVKESGEISMSWADVKVSFKVENK